MALTAAQVKSNLASYNAKNAAPASTTNAAGQRINTAGEVIGGAVTSQGISYDGRTAIPGSAGSKGAIANLAPMSPTATVTSESLKPANLVSIANAPSTQTAAAPSLESIYASLGIGATPTAPETAKTGETQTTQPTSLADILSFQLANEPQREKTADIYAALPEKAAADAARAQVNQFSSQLNAITAQRDADLLRLRGTGAAEGVTEAVYGGQQAAVTREAAIKALPVAAQLSAAQGNLELAQQQLDTVFKLKVADAEADYTAKTRRLESIVNILSASEKRAYDERQTTNKEERDRAVRNADRVFQVTSALLTENPDYIGRFSSLDTKSPNFDRDLARAMNGIPLSAKRQLENAKLAADAAAKTPAGLISGKYEFGTPEYNSEVILNSAQFQKNLAQDQRTRIAQAKSAMGSIEMVNRLLSGEKVTNDDSKAFFGEGTGPVKGRLRTLASQFGGDSAAAAINATIEGLLPQAARGIFAEVGVLTDTDIDRYRKTVGSINTPAEEQKAIMYILTDTLARTYANTLTDAARNQQDVSLFLDEYKNFNGRAEQLKAQLSGNPFQSVVQGSSASIFDPVTKTFNIPTKK